MATQPHSLTAPDLSERKEESRLSYDEGWNLIFSLFGSAKEMYASVGGSEAFMRSERAAWGEGN